MHSSQTRAGMSMLLIANTNQLRKLFNHRPLLSIARAIRTVLARRSFFVARVPPVAAFAAAKARVLLDVAVCGVLALVVNATLHRLLWRISLWQQSSWRWCFWLLRSTRSWREAHGRRGAGGKRTGAVSDRLWELLFLRRSLVHLLGNHSRSTNCIRIMFSQKAWVAH